MAQQNLDFSDLLSTYRRRAALSGRPPSSNEMYGLTSGYALSAQERLQAMRQNQLREQAMGMEGEQFRAMLDEQELERQRQKAQFDELLKQRQREQDEQMKSAQDARDQQTKNSYTTVGGFIAGKGLNWGVKATTGETIGGHAKSYMWDQLGANKGGDLGWGNTPQASSMDTAGGIESGGIEPGGYDWFSSSGIESGGGSGAMAGEGAAGAGSSAGVEAGATAGEMTAGMTTEGIGTAMGEGAGMTMGEMAASEGGGAAAGEGAAAMAASSWMQWIPVVGIAFMAWNAYQKGSGRNEPMEATRDIILGGRTMGRLSKGGEFDPSQMELMKPEWTQNQGDVGGQSLGYSPYTKNDLGQLYHRLHSLGKGASGDISSFLTDQQIDDYLRSMGITNDDLRNALGQDAPDWSSGLQYDQWVANAGRVQAEGREERWRTGQLSPDDLAAYGLSPDDPTYWSMLGEQYRGQAQGSAGQEAGPYDWSATG